MKLNLEAGMTVVCRDNENVEAALDKNQIYVVREISHRGEFIKVQGVAGTFASSRFYPLRSIPPTEMELANASNS